MTPKERFEEWFEKPLSKIEALEGCNAAFLAFMVSFGLFERFIKSDLKKRNVEGTPENFRGEAATVLKLEAELFDKFWGMYRDGIQHYLQPKTFRSKGVQYGWEIDASFSELPEFCDKVENHTKIRIIRISPWKWSKLVVRLWNSRPDLLEVLESHRLGEIYH